MFTVIVYEDAHGHSDIKDLLEDLHKRAESSKDARVNFTKITAYIDALEEMGTRIGEPVTKHLDGEIWELRPLSNRILYACYDRDTFLLLHHFVKKSRKTPVREIEKAKREIEDFRRRNQK